MAHLLGAPLVRSSLRSTSSQVRPIDLGHASNQSHRWSPSSSAVDLQGLAGGAHREHRAACSSNWAGPTRISRGSGHARCLHTSPARLARPVDFYRTLEVSKSASQSEIKAQFYRLSKKYHPDVNQDNANAKAKFQEVSEAYATLGNEQSRRRYDQDQRAAPAGYTRYHNTSGNTSAYTGYTYDPDANASRRARASYAWDYQRRRGDSTRASRGAAREAAGGGAGRRASSSSRAAGFGFGTGGIYDGGNGGGPSSLFEEYAARERRKEQFSAARAANSTTNGSAFASTQGGIVDDTSGSGGSGLMRFIQLIGVLGLILAVGSKGGSSRDGGAGIDTSSLKGPSSRKSSRKKDDASA